MQHAGAGAYVEAPALGARQSAYAAVSHRHALGLTGGAGGVDQISQLVRGIEKRKRLFRLRLPHGLFGIQFHHPSPVNRQLLGQRGPRQQCGRHGVVENVGQPFPRVVGVQRQIRAAGLENSQHGDDLLGRAVQAQPHRRFAVYAQFPQIMGQTIGLVVQFAVAKRACAVLQRDGVGMVRRASGEQGGEGFGGSGRGVRIAGGKNGVVVHIAPWMACGTGVRPQPSAHARPAGDFFGVERDGCRGAAASAPPQYG